MISKQVRERLESKNMCIMSSDSEKRCKYWEAGLTV